jgi:glc operon protein GlcG
LQKKALSLAAARKMVAAAEAEAERNHGGGVVAVVDDGGWVILLERMDHAAMTASVEPAAGKARSATLFKKPTQALEEAINHVVTRRPLPAASSRCKAGFRSWSTAR